MSLLFNIHYRTIIRNAKISGLVPLDDSFSSSKSLYISYDILVTLFLVWKLICATLAIFKNNFEDMMLSQCIAMLTLTGLLLSMFYAAWRPRFLELISRADQLARKVLESSLGREEFFSRLYSSDARLLSSVNNVVCGLTALCPFVHAMSPPILAFSTASPITQLPVPTDCSFEMDVSQLYMAFVFFQFLGLATPALQKLGNEFMMFSLFKIQSAYLKYLSESMEDIELSINTESYSIVSRKLVTWIKLHQEAIKNIQQLQKVYSPVIVLYYLSMIVIVAGGFFYQLNSLASSGYLHIIYGEESAFSPLIAYPRPPGPLLMSLGLTATAEDANVFIECTVGTYMTITIIQFYILCHLADEVASQAERVSVSIYRTSWYKLKGNAWFVGMVINMANKPVSMTAYKTPNFVVNREAFLAFMANLVSAYMGFSKIKEM